MKALKVLAAVAVVLFCLFVVGRYFLAQLSPGGVRQEGPAAIVFAAPSGFEIFRFGELAPVEAAHELDALVARRTGVSRLGVYFLRSGTEIYWLVDRSDLSAVSLRELSASPAGTRLEKIWRGGLEARLASGGRQGSFEVPGLPPAEEKNLYH